ncbi:glycosyltransferase [Bacillaceae bacterium Marseille-Q3522]|nr:glycosyltransferase [Bacillaceae bacterium Marseille-Q3522]
MSHAKIAVSIVTYNSKHIFHVLDNLKKEFASDPSFRFLIFDNHSCEEYQNKLRKYEGFAEITYYHENKGFGFGHNYNLLSSSEKYFLVFNPDIILEKAEIEKMIALLEEERTVSLLVPQIRNQDGTIQHLMRDRVSVFDYFLRFVPFRFIKKLFAKRLASYECRNIPHDRNVDIRIGSGCFMLIRGADFKAINGFDDRYFMYFEDYDLCLEFEKRKKRVVYTPFSSVIHFYERGAHKNTRLFKIFMKSMFQFFQKWGWKLF